MSENERMTTGAGAAAHLGDEVLEMCADRALAGAERAAAERHLAACPACRARLGEWQALFARLEALPEFAPAPGFADRVIARLRPAAAGAAAGAARAARPWVPWSLAWPHWVRRAWPVAAGAAAVWGAAFTAGLVWFARRWALGPAEVAGWALGELREAFWTGVVRVAAAFATAGVSPDPRWALATLVALVALALWGARVLYVHALHPRGTSSYA
jgi:hypothetical protein